MYEIPVSHFQRPDGFSLGYTILGNQFLSKQRPVVCMNGIGMLFNEWETLANELAKSRPVLLYDHRGIGESSFPPGANVEITVPRSVDDLLDLIRYLGWAEIDVIAWSMGGFLLTYLLMETKFQEVVNIRHAVLGAASGGLPECEPGVFDIMGDTFAFAESYEGDKSSFEFRQRMLPGVALYFDRDFTGVEKTVIDRWIVFLSSGRRKAKVFAAQSASGIGYNLRHQLEKIPDSVPLLVIQGTKDRIVLPQEALPYLALPQARPIPVGTQLGEIPHAHFGHLWWEYFTPDIWATALIKFFGDVTSVQT